MHLAYDVRITCGCYDLCPQVAKGQTYSVSFPLLLDHLHSAVGLHSASADLLHNRQEQHALSGGIESRAKDREEISQSREIVLSR